MKTTNNAKASGIKIARKWVKTAWTLTLAGTVIASGNGPVAVTLPAASAVYQLTVPAAEWNETITIV
jgi:hypothetical protein